ncbi:hypothetical protein [Actinoplanes couchii]|uniref:Integral membrane protein n=1 Tax=Actinoplanes couchii TaxID=403638 RepID=A0ABQ3XLY5_9ACTN|nr:hypothetical protein [Actinoplanes couchii]MDR6319269.1 hypothetical protein [Actinoplanes couchii]GID59522.1 hypothetical protein Aco03nite_079260 [Actinoplanes couchii]
MRHSFPEPTAQPPAWTPSLPEFDDSYVPPQRTSDAPGKPAMHILISLVAVAGGIIAAIAGVRLADGGEPWSSLRDLLRGDGYLILLLSVAWLLIGAVLHTPRARRRDANVKDGWLVTGGLLVHHAVVGVVAVPLAAISPPVIHAGRNEADPGIMYPIMLGAVLIVPSLIAACGGFFLRTGTDGEDAVGITAALTMTLVWAVGWVSAAAIVGMIAGHDVLVIPADGLPIVAVGVALAVPSLVAAACSRARWTSMLWDAVTPARLVVGAAALILVTVVVAQSARYVPGAGILVFAILGLPAAYIHLLRRSWRPAPAPAIDRDHPSD